MNLFPQSFQQLERALSTASLKQKVIASNISNVDTPNYKSKSVDFQTTLSNALNAQNLTSYKTDSKHIPFSSENAAFQPKVNVNRETKYKNNGNNVDMDYEMAQMAKNQLWYNAVTDRVNGHFTSLRTVINEGR